VSPAWAETSLQRVLVYGSGAAALEALLVLVDHAGPLSEIELVSPSRDYAIRVPAGGTLDTRPGLRLDLGSLASELGAGFRGDAVTSIDAGHREARTRLGQRLSYDAMIVASGTRLREAIPGAITAWGTRDRTVFSRVIPELLAGDVHTVAFCAHPGDLWTLPLYELALLTAGRLADASIEGAELIVVTWEAAPGQILGPQAGEALSAVLEETGIEVVTEREPIRFEPGLLQTVGDSVNAERAVALPRHDGSYIANIPLDEEGFVPVDDFGRVDGVDGIYAVGAVTSGAIRHASVGAEQARAAAESVAAALGAPIKPRPARRVLSGRLLACPARRAHGGSRGLWWPPEALSGARLRDYLSESVGFELPDVEGGIEIELDLEEIASVGGGMGPRARPRSLS
jgi:NADH dehydrogenase